MNTKSQHLKSKTPPRLERTQSRRFVQKAAESPARTLKITKKQITALPVESSLLGWAEVLNHATIYASENTW